MAVLSRLVLSLVCLVGAHAASAAEIEYELVPLGADTWRYEYSLTNTSSASIFEFSIFFEDASFSSLAVGSTPANWDSIVVQPDVGLGSDGFVDSLSLSGGLAPGGTLSGLSVTFSSLGVTPGAQRFTVVDPNTFETIESGITIPAGVTTPIPEPSSLALLGVGLFALIPGIRRRKS